MMAQPLPPQRLEELSQAVKTLSPALSRADLDVVEDFFHKPIDPASVALWLSPRLGCAWGLAAACDDPLAASRFGSLLRVDCSKPSLSTDWARSALMLIDAALDRTGAPRGARVAAHAQWWRCGLQSALPHRPDLAAFETAAGGRDAALAAWLPGRVSPDQFKRLAAGVAACHLDALCMGQGGSPEADAAFGPRMEWSLALYHEGPQGKARGKDAARGFHWAMIHRAMQADPSIELPESMLAAGRKLAAALSPDSEVERALDEWSRQAGKARALAQRRALESIPAAESLPRAPRI